MQFSDFFKIFPKFDTSVTIKPEQSQVAIVYLLIITLSCFVAGFVFLWFKPLISIIPFAIGGVTLWISTRFWRASNRSIDMQNATPTLIEVKEDGSISFKTDSRALAPPDLLKIFEKLFSIYGHREPLPEPDGLVNENGEPLSDKKSEAIQQVNQINRKAEDTINSLLKSLVGDKTTQKENQTILEVSGNDEMKNMNIPNLPP